MPLTSTEFLAILDTPECERALVILQAHGSTFTTFSASQNFIKKVLELNDKGDVKGVAALAKIANVANSTKRDVEEVLFESEQQAIEGDEIEKFFRMFDNENHRGRLFILVGETGVGKTTAAITRYPHLPVINGSKLYDPYTLCYHLDESTSGNLAPQVTPFLNAMINGGAVILDEFTEFPTETLMFLQGLTDEKPTTVIGKEVVRISPTFKILATMNPHSETDERQALGDALLGRAYGYVMELTDEIIMQRLHVSARWLEHVRKLYTFVAASGMEDVRDLNYRHYQHFAEEGIWQMKFVFCVNSKNNIAVWKKVRQTGEFDNIVKIIEDEMATARKVAQ